jgi:hypothetical protein
MSLLKIAQSGGPRCCKRNTYLAIESAVAFVKDYLNVELETENAVCKFFAKNKECKKNDCKFFPGNNLNK